jgi:hypothetical protein
LACVCDREPGVAAAGDEVGLRSSVLFAFEFGDGWPENPDATTVFPQELVVDWVRVYGNNSAE